jgi:hypothetical protein
MRKTKLSLPTFALAAVVVMSVVVSATASTASQGTNTASSTASTNTSADLLELEMDQNAGVNPKAFGQNLGDYWNVLQQTNDYPRAYHYFSLLAERHPKDATVLGQKGSAIGGLFYWLPITGNQKRLNEEQYAALDRSARSAFDTALQIDPNNFSALLGYAIYEGNTPGHDSQSQALWARLNSLRAEHPEYPWQMVDQLRLRFRPETGK